MSNTLERREPYLLDPEGKPLVKASVVHDRRGQKTVDELLNAIRARANVIRPEAHDEEKKDAFIHHRFWMALVMIGLAFALVALIARSAGHSQILRNEVSELIAIYDWLGFHRVPPAVP